MRLLASTIRGVLTNVPDMSQGGNLGIDRAHHVLYSSNLHAGFWRYVTQ